MFFPLWARLSALNTHTHSAGQAQLKDVFSCYCWLYKWLFVPNDTPPNQLYYLPFTTSLSHPYLPHIPSTSTSQNLLSAFLDSVFMSQLQTGITVTSVRFGWTSQGQKSHCCHSKQCCGWLCSITSLIYIVNYCTLLSVLLSPEKPTSIFSFAPTGHPRLVYF